MSRGERPARGKPCRALQVPKKWLQKATSTNCWERTDIRNATIAQHARIHTPWGESNHLGITTLKLHAQNTIISIYCVQNHTDLRRLNLYLQPVQPTEILTDKNKGQEGLTSPTGSSLSTWSPAGKSVWRDCRTSKGSKGRAWAEELSGKKWALRAVAKPCF